MIFVYILLLLISYGSRNMLDPDLGWHLYLGKYIWQEKTLVTETIGFNAAFGNLYLPDHEWLSDVLMYLAYEKLGYWFMYMTFVATLFFTYYFAYSALKNRFTNQVPLFFALLVSTLPVSLIFAARLQALLLLLISLTYLIYFRIKSYKTRLLLYFLVFLLFANLHGGTLALLPIPVLLEFKNLRDLKKSVVVAIVVLTAISINAYGLEFWALTYDYIKDNYYKNNISEWLPIYNFPVWWAKSIFPLSLYLFVLTINKYWRKLPIGHTALLILYLYLGIQHIRMFAIFSLIAIPFFADAFLDIVKKYKYSQKQLNVFLTLMFLVFFVILSLPLRHGMKKDIFDDRSYPNKALEYIQDNPKEGIILNPYAWGGYLIWKGQDSNLQVFIDGRGPQTRSKTDKTILEEYMRFFDKDEQEIEEALDQYEIKRVLVQRELPVRLSFFNKYILNDILMINQTDLSKNNLGRFLENSQEWQKTFEDEISLIYERTK